MLRKIPGEALSTSCGRFRGLVHSQLVVGTFFHLSNLNLEIKQPQIDH